MEIYTFWIEIYLKTFAKKLKAILTKYKNLKITLVKLFPDL